MKIKFIEEVTIQGIVYGVGTILEKSEDIDIIDLNEKYVAIILNGLRYDVLKSKIEIIQE